MKKKKISIHPTIKIKKEKEHNETHPAEPTQDISEILTYMGTRVNIVK